MTAACGEPSDAVAPPGENAMATVAAAVRATGMRCDDPRGIEYDAAESHADRPAWIIRCQQGAFRVVFEGDTGPKVTPLGQ